MITSLSTLFSSESVSAGHPDKIADQISDAILDAYLEQDPNAKVACECLITTGCFVLAGEISSTACVDVEAIARKTIAEIGYTDESIGFNAFTARCIHLLHTQSPEINKSVSEGGAGDQGLMFGYACRETPELMPLPILLSHKLMEKHRELLASGTLPWLLPDAKAQVTVEYMGDNNPIGISKVVLSTQHRPEIDQEELRTSIIEQLIRPVLGSWIEKHEPEYIINPSGSFTIGGPHGDTGLTGRKIVVDTYGGKAPHGGGAFSGKDPSKVDRSAAYMARYIARHLVLSGYCETCLVQLSYAIGKAEPMSVYVDSRGSFRVKSGNLGEQEMAEIVQEHFDLTPDGIITTLQLQRPIYRSTAVNGHLGNPSFPWEQTDASLVEKLKAAILLRSEEKKRKIEEILERRKREFEAMTVEELVAVYNKGEGSGAWTSTRMRAMHLLMGEMLRRKIDISDICETDPVSGNPLLLKLKKSVRLVGNKIIGDSPN